MEHIYVIRGTNTKKKYFKVGLHTGSKKRLYDRYKTYMIDPDILRFIRCSNSKEHEIQILLALSKCRIRRKGYSGNGRQSEWVKIEKKKLLRIIDSHFDVEHNSYCCC